MAKCSRCGAETKMFVNGIPMCLACSEALAAKTKQEPNDSKT